MKKAVFILLLSLIVLAFFLVFYLDDTSTQSSSSSPKTFSKQLSKNEFTLKFIDEIKKQNPNISIHSHNELEVILSFSKDGESFTAYLDNAYRLYLNGTELSYVLKKHVEAVLSTSQEIPLELKRILPVVKGVEFLESYKNIPSSKIEDLPYHENYADGLVILYALDSEKAVKYISEKEFKELKIDKEELRSAAFNNFKNRAIKEQIKETNGVYEIYYDGNYESSLLLFDDVWERLKTMVDGELIVAIPTRDILIASGSNTIDLTKFKAGIDDVYSQNSYSITRNIYVRKDNKWKILK